MNSYIKSRRYALVAFGYSHCSNCLLTQPWLKTRPKPGLLSWLVIEQLSEICSVLDYA